MIELSQQEIWKIIPGLDGLYEASSLGRIRSVNRVVDGYSFNGKRPITLNRKSVILKQAKLKTGYCTVSVSVGGVAKTKKVHRLVLAAFVGECPDGMICCHGNNDRSDNRIENLRWDTPKSNQNDRIVHGTYLSGEKIKTSKIKECDAIAILNGEKYKSIKLRCDISPSQFFRIKNRQAWAYLDEKIAKN